MKLKMKPTWAVLFFYFIGIGILPAQTITFPVAPANISRALGQALLTVRVDFTAACTNPNITINLGAMRTPNDIEYVTSSITKTGGSASLNITETNISDLKNPVFSVAPNPAPGDFIIFTIARKANCGFANVNRDYVLVNGTGCVAANTDTTSSTYSLLAPVFTLNPPANIINGVVGGTYSRSISIINGGNAIDTVRFFISEPGAGIRLQSSPANTISVGAVNFSPWRSSGDTLFYKLFGSNIFGADNLLTNGESITITENIFLLKCIPTTRYGAYWGKTTWPGCQLVTGSTSVLMATGTPLVSFVNPPTLIQAGNMCSDAIKEVIIRNTGTETTPGAGTAFSVYQSFGNIGGTTLDIRRLTEIRNIQISNNAGGWINLTQTGGTLNTTATVRLNQLTTDPDGANGLRDVDGDGQFDDLPVNQEIRLRVSYHYVCSETCGLNEHGSSFQLQAGFDNQCGVSTLRPGAQTTPNFSYSNRNFGAVPTVTFASDITAGQVFTFRVSSSRDYNVFTTQSASVDRSLVCPTNILRLKLVIPKGLVATAGRFYPNSTSTTASTISFNFVSGSGMYDTAIIEGQVGNTGFYNRFAYEVDYRLDCPTYTGATALNYTIDYTCDVNCSCREIWFCGNFSIKPHCIVNCTLGGLTMTKNKLERTTTGYTTPTSNTFVNATTLSTAQLKIFEGTDNMKGTFEGRYINGTAAPSITKHFFEFKYATPTSAPDKAVEGLAGNLSVYNGITKALKNTYVINLTSSVVTSGEHSLLYDISVAPLVPNDSVVFIPNFTVQRNPNFTAGQLKPLSNLIIRFYSTDNANTIYTCDDFSAEASFYRPAYNRFDAAPTVINGCINSGLQQVSSMNIFTPGVDIYPLEVRPPFIVDSILVQVLSGDQFDLTKNFTLFSYGNSSEGYAAGGGNSTILTPIFRNNNTTAVLVNTGYTWPKGEVSSSSTASGHRLNYFIKGSCSSSSGPLNVTWYLKDYGVSQSVSNYVNNTSISGTDLSTNKPNLILGSTGNVQGTARVQSWDVRLSNTSSIAAPYTWLGFEKGTSGIVIDSVKLLNATRTATVGSNIPLLNYGAGNINKWFNGSVAGLLASSDVFYRVWFNYTSCVTDSIKVIGGWNCESFPSTPLAYPCITASSYLVVIPNESQMDVTVAQQPTTAPVALCSNLSTDFVFNSSAAAFVVNPEFIITRPAGVTISSAQIEYPINSGNWQVITPIVSGNVYRYKINNHTGVTSLYGSNGIPGTADAPALNNRQARLRVNFTTACGFILGSRFFVNIHGDRPCGGAISDANGFNDLVITNPIQIINSGGTGSFNVVSNATSNPNSCGAIPVSASLTPLIDPTSATDTVRITIPPGLTYAGNFVSASGLTVVPGYPQVSASGTLLLLKIPAALSAGTTLTYSFDVSPSAKSGCTVLPILHEAERSFAPLTCNAALCPNNTIAIIGSSITDISISKPNPELKAVALVSAPITLRPGNSITTRVTVTNPSTTFTIPANTLVVEFFCGANTVFHTATFPLAIAPMATVNTTFTMAIPNTPTCNGGDIFKAVIRPSATQCICDSSGSIYNLVLPIKFVFFKASKSGRSLVLDWAVENNDDTKSYEVEMSTDGIRFQTIKSVNHKDQQFTYSTSINNLPDGKYFFRIRALQPNGLANLSEWRMVLLGTSKDVSVFPNPATQQAQILAPHSITQIRLLGIDGQQILQVSPKNTNSYNLQLGSLKSGKYMLRILLENSEWVTKMIEVIH